MRCELCHVLPGLFIVLAASSSARADAVVDWNRVATQTTAAAPFDPPAESRNLAIVHAAIYDAVNAISAEFEPYQYRGKSCETASEVAAAASAAHDVLVALYPEQRATLDGAYVAALAELPDDQARADGEALGKAVARSALDSRSADGAGQPTAAEDVAPEPGVWRPTPPKFAAGLHPEWGAVRPFVLQRGSQFRPAPPPALQSAQYARDFAEIVAVGSAQSETRTPEQTAAAQFWTASGPQLWNAAARRLASERGDSVTENARTFALLNLAGADAMIAAWDTKYTYRQWRPVTAIRSEVDPDWTPLLVTPPFPDYIAGHATYAGASAAVLEAVFGRTAGPIVMDGPDAALGVQTYATLRDAVHGVIDARVHGGVHWRTSCVQGGKVGRSIGRYVLHEVLRPAR